MKPPISPARWMGEIQLAQPLSTAWLAWLSLLISAAVVVALFTVDYTRKERVTGQLSLDTGLVKIYGPSTIGVVVKKLVKEGATVVAGLQKAASDNYFPYPTSVVVASAESC